MVYIMNLRQNFGVPSDSYVHTVSEGYRNCRLDMSVLKDAIRQSVPRYADTISDRLINSIGYEQMGMFDFDIAEINIEEDDDEDISDEMYAEDYEDQEEDEDDEELDDENSFIPIQ